MKRHFNTPTPPRLLVAGITHVLTCQGLAYVAFITDVFSQRIIG